jgi:hypothetical protein
MYVCIYVRIIAHRAKLSKRVFGLMSTHMAGRSHSLRTPAKQQIPKNTTTITTYKPSPPPPCRAPTLRANNVPSSHTLLLRYITPNRHHHPSQAVCHSLFVVIPVSSFHCCCHFDDPMYFTLSPSLVLRSLSVFRESQWWEGERECSTIRGGGL